jgi:hypothetical protein
MFEIFMERLHDFLSQWMLARQERRVQLVVRQFGSPGSAA